MKQTVVLDLTLCYREVHGFSIHCVDRVRAVSSVVAVLLQGMNLTSLENQSITSSIESNLLDRGRSVVKSAVTSFQGLSSKPNG